MNGIYSIAPAKRPKVMNSMAAGFTHNNTYHAEAIDNIVVMKRVLADHGINGDGVNIIVTDTYLDTNSTYFYDSNYPSLEYSKYYDEHRKISVIYHNFDKYQETMGANEHGTHTAGSVAGKSTSSSDSALFNGIAPNSKIAFIEAGTDFVHFDQIKEISDKIGAAVNFNGWGFQTVENIRAWDQEAYDNENITFVFPAGNDGLSNMLYQVNTPAVCKNNLAVGAISQLQVDMDSEESLPVVAYIVNEQKNIYEALQFLPWSSPTGLYEELIDSDYKEVDIVTWEEEYPLPESVEIIRDARDMDRAIARAASALISLTKFDVPNSTHIDIPVFYATDSDLLFYVINVEEDKRVKLITNFKSKQGSIEIADYSSKGPGLYGIIKPDVVAPGTNIFSSASDPNGDYNHEGLTVKSGSSMAAANIAGAVALITHYFKDGCYKNLTITNLSSALVRSILVNAADPLSPDTYAPNIVSGFGLVNLHKYLHFIDDSNGLLINDHIKTGINDHLISTITVKDNTKDLRVTIAYSDIALSSDSLVALTIDYDLVVEDQNGVLIRGNHRTDGTEEQFSTIERVVIPADQVKAGVYKIHVFSHVPAEFADQRIEFAATAFGSFDSTDDFLQFTTTTECLDCNGGTCGKDGKCYCDENTLGQSCQTQIHNFDKEVGEDSILTKGFETCYIRIKIPATSSRGITYSVKLNTENMYLTAYSVGNESEVHKHEFHFDGVHDDGLDVTINDFGPEAPKYITALVYNNAPDSNSLTISATPYEPPTQTKVPVTEAPTEQQNEKSNTTTIIAATVGSIVFVIIIVTVFIVFKKRGSMSRDQITSSLIPSL